MTSVVTPAAPEETPEAPPSGVGAAVSEYLARVRGGDVGSLPAVLGLVVLLIVFSALKSRFSGAPNIANLLNQSSALIVIAMGLVFVLLLGEIDLSAGYTAGTGAAVIAIVATRHGEPWPVAVLAGLGTGIVIGLFIGLLVSRLGIPSFVVTLAAFLGLQGVLLKLVGDQGTISVATNKTLVAINNKNLPVWAGWVMFAILIAGYAGVTLSRAFARQRDGLVADATSVVLAKVGLLAVLLAGATAFLSKERSLNRPTINAAGVHSGVSIKGVPEVMVLLVVLLVGLNFLLGRTAFGRHVYAVGGNAEAARRSGINVQRVKLICFMLCSTLATVGGLLLMSRDNSVDPKTGGSDTLLYAVGAAVIGGTSLFGGKGKIMDPVLGGLVIATIINGMGLLNASSAVVYIVTGIVLLVAASVDAISRRRAASTGRV